MVSTTIFEKGEKSKNNLNEKVAQRADVANYGTGMEETKKSAKCQMVFAVTNCIGEKDFVPRD